MYAAFWRKIVEEIWKKNSGEISQDLTLRDFQKYFLNVNFTQQVIS